MEYKKNGVSAEVYPYLYEYESLGGAYTEKGRWYGRKFFEGILSEIERMSEIEKERINNFENSKNIHIPEILTRAELITIPLMKTHNKTVITGAIKNQWGCLQTLRHNFHLVLAEALVDVNAIVRPRFAVMDATIGLEGNGPKSGKPKEAGLVLASGDFVALDAIAAQIMGFDPLHINHIQLCSQHGLGSGDPSKIQVVGERVENVITPFLPAKHNAVSWLELMLRRSAIKWLVFDTPIFHLFCWGTRRYYNIWEVLKGRKLRAEILKHSLYAAQWTTTTRR